MNDGKAYACADRASLGFAQEFGSGTYIGQKPQETLSIRNGGSVDLDVESVNFSGDSAFTMTVEPVAPVKIKGNKYIYARVVFAPTEARAYSGTITVKSNAATTDGGSGPVMTFAVTGCGVPTDGGTSPCYRDGGM